MRPVEKLKTALVLGFDETSAERKQHQGLNLLNRFFIFLASNLSHSLMACVQLLANAANQVAAAS